MKPSEAKGNNSLTGTASGNWTLVDEGGEEVRVIQIKSWKWFKKILMASDLNAGISYIIALAAD